MHLLGHFTLMSMQVALLRRPFVEICQPWLRVEAANDEGGPAAA